MIQWCNRVTISDNVAQMSLDPAMGNEMVDFTFINVKTGKETTSRFPLDEAIKLAEYKREDKRYKNFEFHIG